MYAISDPVGASGSLTYAVVAKAGEAADAEVIPATYGSSTLINMQVRAWPGTHAVAMKGLRLCPKACCGSDH